MTTDLSTLPNLEYFRLLHSCIRQNDADAEAERARAFLHELSGAGTRVAPVMNESQRTLLGVLLKYFRDSHESPTLARFVELIESLDKKAGPLQMIDEYKALLTGFTAHTVRELPSLIDAMACVYRDYFASSILSVARQAITGMTVHDNGKPKELKGWQDAFTFLRSEMARPAFRVGASLPEGVWQDNAIAHGETFLERLGSLAETRIYTGFRAIDDTVIIGPKEAIRYVGVLAATNHGKTTFLTALAYNLSLQGKKTLLVPLEGGAEGAWDRLAFLHAYRHRGELDIPPAHAWQHDFASITDRQKDDYRLLVSSVKEEMRGKLDVKVLFRWQDIIAHLEAASDKEPFDAVILDYTGHLETGLAGDKEMAEMRSIFKQGQLLTQTYKNDRGIILITGLQANKKGVDAAAAAQPPGSYRTSEGGPGYGGIEYYTRAAHDLDLLVGIWHSDDVILKSQMTVSCVKSKTRFFPTHWLQIDEGTRMLLDSCSAPVRPGAEKRERDWKDDSMPRDFAFDDCADLQM